MKSRVRILFTLLVLFSPASWPQTTSHADLFRQLTDGVTVFPDRQACSGVVPVSGSSFGLVEAGDVFLVAVGRSAFGGFMVAAGHDFFFGSGSDAVKQLNLNIYRWVGGAETILGFDPVCEKARVAAEATGLKVTKVSAAHLSIETCQSWVVSGHTPLEKHLERITAFVRAGGNILFHATAWALDSHGLKIANRILGDFGLAYGGDGGTFPQVLSPALAAPENAEQAFLMMSRVIAGRDDMPEKAELLRMRDRLNGASRVLTADFPLMEKFRALALSQPWVEITREKPLIRAERVVDDWLVTEQSRILETWPPENVPAHPSHRDWPGAVDETAPRVTRTFTVSGETLRAADRYGVNHHQAPVWRPLPVYVPAGGARHVVVTLSENAVGKGVEIQVGHGIEDMIGAPNAEKRYERWPKLHRRFPVKEAQTTVGSAFGGLIIILIPGGVDLGDVTVTVAGAVDAPAWIHGKSDEDVWLTQTRFAPGAWGYLETEKIVLFVSRNQLAKLLDPMDVGAYWTRIMNTSDRFLGVKNRKRGEAAACDRQITVGYGHAGYPVVMAYGDSDVLISRKIRDKGDWGFYHELGHTFQDIRESDYDIALHGEVYVNMNPSLLMIHEHKTTSRQGIHGTFDSQVRETAWKEYFALPESERTWKKAHDMNPMAYDFYLQLADAFGWEVYEKALGSLWDKARTRSRRGSPAKVDELCVELSKAAAHDLCGHFRRYGLVVAKETEEELAGLPEWTENRPGRLEVASVLNHTLSGHEPVVLTQAHHIDPDPGTRVLFAMKAGVLDEVLTIDEHSGHVVLVAPSKAPSGTFELEIRSRDDAVPTFEQVKTVVLNLHESEDRSEPETEGAQTLLRTTLSGMIQTAGDSQHSDAGLTRLRESTLVTSTSEPRKLRIYGHFVPTRTGRYRFFVAGDGQPVLKFSPTREVQHLWPIAAAPFRGGALHFDADSRAMSREILLVAGRVYALEVSESDPKGSTFMSLAFEGPEIRRHVMLSEE